MKMENSMNAILTLVGVGIGFVNGYVWSKLLKLKEITHLQEKLYAKDCLNDGYLYTIEKLETQNNKLRQIIASNEEMLESIRLMVSKPNCLPPPNSPLVRSEPLLRSSSDSSVLSSMD